MRLLMESVPREHEKRTVFSFRVQGCACVCARTRGCAYLNHCKKQMSSHFVGPYV